MSWRIAYTKQAQRDAKRLRSSGLKPNTEEPLALLADNPYRKPPPFEKLVGAVGENVLHSVLPAFTRRVAGQRR